MNPKLTRGSATSMDILDCKRNTMIMIRGPGNTISHFSTSSNFDIANKAEKSRANVVPKRMHTNYGTSRDPVNQNSNNSLICMLIFLLILYILASKLWNQ
ncbi:hypothetical protein CDAR_300921 [Caerostris darwini]|uniref:Uncharacterized protein n=1 Tax=Caerostris darwini TaxID=1538125 RepID=A0AAV4WAN2_9ARAC|nr:hypothetical protein CDAR_300921 [Caerostris darwini]